jgi:hypothetical protein
VSDPITPLTPEQIAANAAKRGSVARICKVCQRPFRVSRATIKRGGGRGQHCSRACQFAMHRVEKTCPNCGKNFTINKSRDNRRRCCSWECRATAHPWLRKGPANPKWVGGNTKERRRDGNLRHFYGINQNDFDALLKAQGGVCAICKNPPTGKRAVLCVDHDHKDGRLKGEARGLLCHRCNMLVGYLEGPFWKEALEYLARTAKREAA